MFQIKNRWTGNVQFECELPAEMAQTAYSAQLAFAVKKAVNARADLANADLADVDLAGAYLAGANLAGAKIRSGITITRAPLAIHGLTWPVVIYDEHMQIGCEFHSLVEWAAFDNDSIARMDPRNAPTFWRAHKATLLALAAADGRGVKETTP